MFVFKVTRLPYAAAAKERDALSQLLAVKDNMIWTLVEERARLQRQASGGAAEIEALRAELAAARSAQPVIYAPPTTTTTAAATTAEAGAGAGAGVGAAAGTGEGGKSGGAAEAKKETPPPPVTLVLNVGQ